MWFIWCPIRMPFTMPWILTRLKRAQWLSLPCNGDDDDDDDEYSKGEAGILSCPQSEYFQFSWTLMFTTTSICSFYSLSLCQLSTSFCQNNEQRLLFKLNTKPSSLHNLHIPKTLVVLLWVHKEGNTQPQHYHSDLTNAHDLESTSCSSTCSWTGWGLCPTGMLHVPLELMW